jgi:hypothetical protein
MCPVIFTDPMNITALDRSIDTSKILSLGSEERDNKKGGANHDRDYEDDVYCQQYPPYAHQLDKIVLKIIIVWDDL